MNVGRIVYLPDITTDKDNKKVAELLNLRFPDIPIITITGDDNNLTAYYETIEEHVKRNDIVVGVGISGMLALLLHKGYAVAYGIPVCGYDVALYYKDLLFNAYECGCALDTLFLKHFDADRVAFKCAVWLTAMDKILPLTADRVQRFMSYSHNYNLISDEHYPLSDNAMFTVVASINHLKNLMENKEVAEYFVNDVNRVE